MIGTIDVDVQAKFPNMPLDPMMAYVGSPSSIRVRNAPKRIGDWCIRSVQFVAAYPDGSIKTAECVLVGGVWVGTIEGTSTSGTSKNGYTIFANGTDENGNNVTGYVLGKGDITILEADGTLNPDAPSFYVHYFDTMPEQPRVGDSTFLENTYYIYDGTQWKPCVVVATPSYIEDSNGNKIEADRDFTQVDFATSWVIDDGISEHFLSGSKDDASEPRPENPLDGAVRYGLRFGEAYFPEGWTLTVETYSASSGHWNITFLSCEASEEATELEFAGGITATWQKATTTTGKLATEEQVSQKQDQLSEAQIMAIDLDADMVLTKFYVQGESQMYSFIASSSALSKDDFAAQGVYDTTTGTWLKPLQSIRTGTNVTSLQTSLFKDVTSLQHFEGSSLVGLQGGQAFGGCTGLQSLTLPKINLIPTLFCKDCTALRNLIIPASVTSIGRHAFQNCSNLSVHFEEKSLAEVQAMGSYPWGLTTTNITASKTATQEWVDSAISGKADLTDVGNATITLTQGGVTKGTFTTNQSANATIDLDAGGGGGIGYTVTVRPHIADGDTAAGGVTVGGFSVNANSVGDSGGLNVNGHDCPDPLVLHGIEYIDVPAHAHSGLVYFNGVEKNNQFVQLTGDTTVDLYKLICIAGGTLIPLADGISKPIEDITYDDELLVWDFDEGKLSSAKPAWIKKADYVFYSWETKLASGKSIKTCGQHGHRFFDLGTNTWIYADEISGKTIYTLDGADEVVSSQCIDGKVNFYNIITKGHINHFGNDILLGCSLENYLYPVENMKFVKDNRALRPYSEFERDVPEWWYNECRYAESTASRDYLVKYCKDRLPIMLPKS